MHNSNMLLQYMLYKINYNSLSIYSISWNQLQETRHSMVNHDIWSHVIMYSYIYWSINTYIYIHAILLLQCTRSNNSTQLERRIHGWIFWKLCRSQVYWKQYTWNCILLSIAIPPASIHSLSMHTPILFIYLYYSTQSSVLYCIIMANGAIFLWNWWK